MRVASGLDSLVLGEPQILGQLKDAYRTAVTAGTAGKFINRLMQFSFATAKLVRSQTDIGNSPVSVAFAAVKLAQQIHGQLDQRSALLIGAGDTISLVANHLRAARIGRLAIANRTYAKAAELAEALYRRVPAGVGSHGSIVLDEDGMTAMLQGGAAWAVERGFGRAR